MVYALVDVARRERVRYGSKLLWVVVIVLINIIGPIIYLAWGRMPAEGGGEDYGP
ncbi:MAG: PLDc N-terminal domain-containing protein [Actinobacteria bacterium]|nr:PLDc N-terminal domain-containing protein [Actinomycetota bacterium]